MTEKTAVKIISHMFFLIGVFFLGRMIGALIYEHTLDVRYPIVAAAAFWPAYMAWQRGRDLRMIG